MSIALKLQERLEPLLEQAGGEFRKLTKDDEPYYFVEWALDGNQQRCLYYGFAARDASKRDHEKRVPLSELANAIAMCARKGKFERADFDDCCSVAKSAGPCGFAIVGRSMEFLGVAEHDPDGHCFTLISSERAAELLRDE